MPRGGGGTATTVLVLIGSQPSGGQPSANTQATSAAGRAALGATTPAQPSRQSWSPRAGTLATFAGRAMARKVPPGAVARSRSDQRAPGPGAARDGRRGRDPAERAPTPPESDTTLQSPSRSSPPDTNLGRHRHVASGHRPARWPGRAGALDAERARLATTGKPTPHSARLGARGLRYQPIRQTSEVVDFSRLLEQGTHSRHGRTRSRLRRQTVAWQAASP